MPGSGIHNFMRMSKFFMRFSMRFLILSLLCGCAVSAFGQLSFSGNSRNAITVTPDASSGLEAVYVLDGTDGVTASYPSASARWYRFSNMGGAYAEEISATGSAGTSTVSILSGDMGYIVEDGGRQHCFWVVDYSRHRLVLDALTISPESQCDRTVLEPHGNGARITYYSINGAPRQLSRDMSLTYRTLEFDDESFSYREKQAEEIVESFDQYVTCPAPLCNTAFTLSGDRFLREWGDEISVESPNYNTPAVEARSKAEQRTEEFDNQQKTDTEGLGGSAPCEITFTASVSDAVVFREWQFSRTPEFEDVYERYNSDEFTRTFDENGTTYIRFYCANDAGNCEFTGDVYTVDIGESRLECPNAFSPANQDGVNDLWKVSYMSIISFDCHIFNRWGKELAHLTHPSQGWDGKTGGKFVPSGVYYYVIKARGADGRNYDLSGDINIINSRTNTNPGSGEVE